MHSDHMVHASADLSSWLDSPMFWANMSTYSQPSFFSSTWKRGMDVQTKHDILRTVEDKRLSYY